MRLKVVKSGSSGNCYLLSTDKGTLLMDCGVKLADIKKSLKYDVKSVVGCIVSHSHSDHSKSVEDLKKMGIKVFLPYNITKSSATRKNFGRFEITEFPLPHDDTKNYGFFIKVNGEKILYLTDLEYCKLNFKKQKVNHILIECNYQDEFANKDLPNYEHKIKGHCSLKTCKEFIKSNATEDLRTVLLIHMGRETCEPEECVDEVKKVARNAIVDYARDGMEIELQTGKCPFV